MFSFVSKAQLALLGLTLLSACSTPPEKSKTRVGGGNAIGSGPGAKDPYVAPEKLNLDAIVSDPTSEKSYDFTQPSEMVWASNSEVILTHGDGKSISYNFKSSAWTSVHSEHSITEYVSLYDFRDAGFFGTTADHLSFHRTPDPIVRLIPAADFKPTSLVGANPGFVAYTVGPVINAVVTTGESAKLYALDTAPAGLSLVYPCNLHCIFWGFDGSSVHLFFEGAGWIPMAGAIKFPEGEEISRMAIRFRSMNNPVAAESVVIQTKTGKLYAQVAGTVEKTEPTWDDIKALSSRFCVNCHLDDGFEKEDTWKGLKTAIVSRLQMESGMKGAMPPSETNIGKEMSQGERGVILAWIKKQTEIERGPIGPTVDPVADNSDTKGDLKTLGDKYCVACHVDASKNAFWTREKGKSITQVTSGAMPRGKTMTADEKKKLLELLNAIK